MTLLYGQNVAMLIHCGPLALWEHPSEPLLDGRPFLHAELYDFIPPALSLPTWTRRKCAATVAAAPGGRFYFVLRTSSSMRREISVSTCADSRPA